MKYRFLLFSAFLSSATVFGQQMVPNKVTGAERPGELQIATEPAVTGEGPSWTEKILSDGLGTVVMYEDFSTGVPGTWTNGSLTNGNEEWEYRGPSTTPNANTGSRGAFATGLGPIQSTTRANGFMIFDSDWWDNGGTQGGTGQQSATSHSAHITTGSIDCSSYPQVILTFESYTRNFNSNMFVIVSNDNFATADTLIDLNDEVETNEQSETDEFIRLDISDVAGGEVDVKVRFLYASITDNNLDPGYYFWMIDDVTLITPADFDLSLDEKFHMSAGGLVSQFQYATFPNRIPMKQVSANGMTFGAALTSWGSGIQPNGRLEVDVTGSGSFSSSSVSVNYASFERDTVDVQDVFTPTSLGNYVVNFEVLSDSVDDYTFDNEAETEFNVTEHMYAWDNDDFDDGVSWSNGTHSLFQRFDMFAEDTIAAVEFGIWSSNGFASSDQSVVEVGVWEVTGYDAGGNIVVDLDNPIASTFYTISTAEFNTVIRAQFNEPVPVPTGVTEVVAGYRYQAGLIRSGLSDLDPGFLNCWVDVDSDGEMDGWVDFVPVIHIETWSADICDQTTIVLDDAITCESATWEAIVESIVSTNGDNNFTYEWSTGEDTEDITVDEEGTYSYTVTDGNFCTATHTFDVLNADINCNLSVGDLNNESFGFNVVPNPNNGVFTLQFEAQRAENVRVMIQTLKGEIVKQDAMTVSNGQSVDMNLSDLSNGIYLVKVTGDTHTSVERVIVQ